MSEQSPKSRQTATERRAQQTKNPYGTTSASARRARDRASGKAPAPASHSDPHESGLTTAQISDLLDHPTKFVSEAELRAQYAYVLQDLRSMGILTAALFALLVALALLLPQVGV
jgi:hypothetical protein